MLNFFHPLEAITLELDLFLLSTSLFLLVDDIDADDEYDVGAENYLPNRDVILEITLATLINSLFGNKLVYYKNFLVVILLILVTVNLIGLVPNMIVVPTMLPAIVLIFSLSLLLLAIGTGLALYKAKFGAFFVPDGCPEAIRTLLIFIESFTYGLRVVSLTLRLVANLASGHLLLKMVAGILFYILFTVQLSATIVPVALLCGILGLLLFLLEIGINVLQAAIYCILSDMYLAETSGLNKL